MRPELTVVSSYGIEWKKKQLALAICRVRGAIQTNTENRNETLPYVTVKRAKAIETELRSAEARMVELLNAFYGEDNG